MTDLTGQLMTTVRFYGEEVRTTQWMKEKSAVVQQYVGKFGIIEIQLFIPTNSPTNTTMLQQQIIKALKKNLGEEEKELYNNTVVATSLSRISSPYHESLRWLQILACLWKINCDSTWNEGIKRGGIGWIIRRWDGSPVAAGCVEASIDNGESIGWKP